MTTENQRLRPLELGQLFDSCLRLYRRHLKLIFALSGFALALSYIVIKPQVNLLWPLVQDATNLGGNPSLDVLLDRWIPLVRNVVFLIMSGLLMSTLAEGLVVEAAHRLYLGQSATFWDTLRRFAPRIPKLLLTRLMAIFIYGAIGVTSIILIGFTVVALVKAFLGYGLAAPQAVALGTLITMALIGMPALGLILWLTLCWVLLPQIVIVEGRGYFSALRRSMRMIRSRDPGTRPQRHLTRAVILLLAYTAIYSSLDGVVASIYMAAGAIFGYRSGHGMTSLLSSPSYVPQAVAVPLELLMTFFDAALQPLVWLAMLVLYFDIRVRSEGYDLERLADRLADPGGKSS